MRFAKRLISLLLGAALSLSLLTGCAEEAVPSSYDLSVRVGAAPASLDPIYAEDPGDHHGHRRRPYRGRG